jgi:anti-sigma regulatory factor (Ser/Thr protein kinase)
VSDPARVDARLDVPPEPSAVRQVRAFVRSALAGSVDEDALDTIVLLTSEVVTNAILHAKTASELHLVRLPDVVRVEIADRSPAIPERRVLDFTSASGRGLAIVEAVAIRWGVEGAAASKRVWFEVRA